MTEPPPIDRAATVSRGEEIANTVSHGVGLLAVVAVTPFVIVGAVRQGGTAVIVGSSVFAATMVMLYLVSTLYHALPIGRPKRVLRVVDHAAIFFLIAGTYTPFTLGVLRGSWGWSLFGIVWSLCVIGVAFKTLRGVAHPRISLMLYVLMGWLAIVAIGPIVDRMPAWGITWIVAGGLAYTAGIGFFAADRLRYSHLLWHLCVMAGTGCHVVAVMGYAA